MGHHNFYSDLLYVKNKNYIIFKRDHAIYTELYTNVEHPVYTDPILTQSLSKPVVQFIIVVPRRRRYQIYLIKICLIIIIILSTLPFT